MNEHSGRPRSGKRSAAYYAAVIAAIWAILIPVWILSRPSTGPRALPAGGAELFKLHFTPAEGLGPLFNRSACSGCHGFPAPGGVGRNGLATELRIGRLSAIGFDPMLGRGGPFARARSISELGAACDLQPGIPAGANISSVRNTPPLFGDGLIDAIPDRVILARAAVERREGIDGKPNFVRQTGGRVEIGRFGWKGDTPTLREFVGQALRNELGITNPIAPTDFIPSGSRPCPGESSHPELGGRALGALTAFVSSLRAPRPGGFEPTGAETFAQIGCASCHVPTLQANGLEVHLYSDLLLHDMGPALNDHIVQGSATGSEWRTAPLWGLHLRSRYLHDGRATTLRAAILAHGGQAATARGRFLALSSKQQYLLLKFLGTL